MAHDVKLVKQDSGLRRTRFYRGTKRFATRKISNQPRSLVVPARDNSTAEATNVFFERRTRVMMRAFGSPNTPLTVGSGRNPGNAYASQRCRCRFVELAIKT
jgi:hypothetical protein